MERLHFTKCPVDLVEAALLVHQVLHMALLGPAVAVAVVVEALVTLPSMYKLLYSYRGKS